MGTVGIFGGLIGLLFPLIGLVFLYFVITLAVRHGIDNSEAGRKIIEQARRDKNPHQ